jgi:hypothetical protein
VFSEALSQIIERLDQAHKDRLLYSYALIGGFAVVPVQLIVLQPNWAQVAFKDVERLNVIGCSVPVVNWQALVLLKLYAGGPVDLQDARNIVAVRKPDAIAREDLLAQADVLGLAQEMRILFGSMG